MRRETDFVLEHAPWPALLLEEKGGICRANRAAHCLFGAEIQTPLTPLTPFWAPENALSLSNFVSQPTGGTCKAKFLLTGGQKGDFFAHLARLVRDGQTYLLLQLFKDSGGHFPDLATFAPAEISKKPEKAQAKEALTAPLPIPSPAPVENVFPLEKSVWPALLVQKNGMIQRANEVALQAFGTAVGKTDTQFATLWLANNKESAQHFLQSTCETGVQANFRLKTGETSVFLAHACPAEKDCVLVQLFKAAAQNSPAQTTPTPPIPANVTPASPASASTSGSDTTTFAYKQKLDCAMQLARSISLDLNNALTSILGHSSLALSKVEAGNTWRASLVEIEKSASRAAEIASDLASFSRQEKESRGQVGSNLNNLLERAVEGLKAQHSSIAWSFQFDRKLCTATVDEAKIQQAFIKVLENAAESITSNGQVNIQTRNLELSEPTQDRTVKLNPGTYVCIEISDNGQGIAADVLPRIFEPFFTTKGKNHRGLGLAWVYGIVTNHGGGVAVSSQTPSGTSVRIYLPANKKVIKDVPAKIDDLTGNQTVLIVDDEDLLLTMGQMVLSSFGYTVLTANSGQKALEILKQAKQPVDLMITDLVMPRMSGRELTDQVQKLSPQTRILWSSGYVLNDVTAEHRTYLQKPFTSQDLLRKVKEVLAG